MVKPVRHEIQHLVALFLLPAKTKGQVLRMGKP